MRIKPVCCLKCGCPDAAYGLCSSHIISPHILLCALPWTTKMEHMLFLGYGSRKAQYLFCVPIKRAISSQRQQVHSAPWDRLFFFFLNTHFIWGTDTCKKCVAVYLCMICQFHSSQCYYFSDLALRLCLVLSYTLTPTEISSGITG